MDVPWCIFWTWLVIDWSGDCHRCMASAKDWLVTSYNQSWPFSPQGSSTMDVPRPPSHMWHQWLVGGGARGIMAQVDRVVEHEIGDVISQNQPSVRGSRTHNKATLWTAAAYWLETTFFSFFSSQVRGEFCIVVAWLWGWTVTKQAYGGLWKPRCCAPNQTDPYCWHYDIARLFEMNDNIVFAYCIVLHIGSAARVGGKKINEEKCEEWFHELDR